MKRIRSPLALPPPGLMVTALLLAWAVGILGRGYWTPDEPREADIAWRMSWQSDRAVPLLAGEAFCEKPPLTYWLAAGPIRWFGTEAWAARLPNLLYAMLTALGVLLLSRRSAGRVAGWAGAAAISTFLLAYQTTIWLATDAPLLAAVSLALAGMYAGLYATGSAERLRGYCLMHAALGLGFLSKSAVAWMVPALAMLTLVLWEKRWRELLRWELYVGLLLQAAMILAWVWFVYRGPDGVDHLKVFFWNNLVGRFTPVEAPAGLQYAAAHRNSPGKYLIELPLYLFPWTLLVIAAARRAWRGRRRAVDELRAVRFALAAALPALAVLSLAATARNIYLAPALPGAALLLAWWVSDMREGADLWDIRALRATAILLLLSSAVFIAALGLVGADAWATMTHRGAYVLISTLGLLAAVTFALRAWVASARRPQPALCALLVAYCALLVGPASQIYRQVDTWQDLAAVAHAIARDAAGRPVILFAPDETTRAVVDMYTTTSAQRVTGPPDAAAIAKLRADSAAAPHSVMVVQLPGRAGLRGHWPARGAPQAADELPWTDAAPFQIVRRYSLPNGRRYALLQRRIPEQPP